MGIRGLWSFLTDSPHSDAEKNFDFWGERVQLTAGLGADDTAAGAAADSAATPSGGAGGRPSVCVDGSSLMYFVYEQRPSLDWLCGGQPQLFIERCEAFLRSLLRAADVLIVLEGCPEDEKERRGTLVERWNTRISALSTYMATGDPDMFTSVRPPPLMSYLFGEAIDNIVGDPTREPHHMVEVFHAQLREADDLAAAVAIHRQCYALIAGDTDYVAIPGVLGYISLKSLDFTEFGGAVRAVRYTPEDSVTRFNKMIAACTAKPGRFDAAFMPDLACLLGNDILNSSELASFHSSLLDAYGLDRKQVVLAVARFLATTTLPRLTDVRIGDPAHGNVLPGVLDIRAPEFARAVLGENVDLASARCAAFLATYVRAREQFVKPDAAAILASSPCFPPHLSAAFAGERAMYLHELLAWQRTKLHPLVEKGPSNLHANAAPVRAAVYEILLADPTGAGPATRTIVEARKKSATEVGMVDVLVSTRAAAPLYGGAAASATAPVRDASLADAAYRAQLYARHAAPDARVALYEQLLDAAGFLAGAHTPRDRGGVSAFSAFVLRALAQLPGTAVRAVELDVLILAAVLHAQLGPTHELRAKVATIWTARQAQKAAYYNNAGPSAAAAASADRKPQRYRASALQLCTLLQNTVFNVFWLGVALGSPVRTSLAAVYDGNLVYRVYNLLLDGAGSTDALAAAVLGGGPLLTAKSSDRQSTWRAIADAAQRLKLLVLGNSRYFSGLGALPVGRALFSELRAGLDARDFAGADGEAVDLSAGTAAELALPALDASLYAACSVERHERALVAVNSAVHAWLGPRTRARHATWWLLVYGSMRLGVMAADSDIDVVCVGPHDVPHAEFFAGELAALLAALPHVSLVRAIPDALDRKSVV